MEVTIADEAAGEPAPVGTTGELCTRGICVMTEYFDDPAATSQAVASASVVELPDEEWGEVVAAFIQLRPGAAPGRCGWTRRS